MKSFCIKTNNKNIIDYLLENIENINMNKIYFSNKSFKIYSNIILHYTGDSIDAFYTLISNILCNCIIKFYENDILKYLININYFYFSSFERREILESAINYINSFENPEYFFRKEEITNSIICYIKENKSMILDGFINFRLKDYFKTLDNIVDICVNNFLIEREYSEFVNLLKIYVESTPSKMDIAHIIYQKGESIILDENKSIISKDENILNAKYLSDITFSSNDYSLNTLLSILPEKIYLHVIDSEDDFINTIKLIFTNRITICDDCNICKTYKILNSNKTFNI